MRRIVTPEQVVEAAATHGRRLAAPRATTVVTPEAWSRALELGVEIDRDAEPEPAAPDPGGAERVVDRSGVLVVKGGSVRLGRFTGAGRQYDVGLTDVVTAKDRAPMTAGFMAWRRDDSFPWKLDYDEVDLVLEGVLHVEIDGRVLEARPGDVVFIPKGSAIVFGTPSHVRVFYVTYPAEWNAPK
jgi:ethanolamine utilization protein EutQ